MKNIEYDLLPVWFNLGERSRQAARIVERHLEKKGISPLRKSTGSEWKMDGNVWVRGFEIIPDEMGLYVRASERGLHLVDIVSNGFRHEDQHPGMHEINLARQKYDHLARPGRHFHAYGTLAGAMRRASSFAERSASQYRVRK